MPTPEQRAQVSATAADLQARFDAGQALAAQAHAHELAEWKAKQAACKKARKQYEAACQALQRKLANPDLAPEQREDLAKTPLPVMPAEGSPTPPPPPNGDPKANQSFDALIYKFRQAVSARNHAQATAVMAQMAELAPKISPSLMAVYREDAKGYLAWLKQMAAAAPPTTTQP